MRTTLLLAGLALCLLAATPPRPALVHDGPDGETGLSIGPAVSTVHVAPGSGTVVTLRLSNGSDTDVTATLTVLAVDADDQGRPRLAEAGAGAAGWVTLAEPQVRLAAGTVTELGPAVNVPAAAGGAGVFAIRATVEPPVAGDGAELSALVAVAPPGAGPDVAPRVQVEREGGDTHLRVTLTNTGDAAAVVSLRTGVAGWTGRRLVAQDAAPLLVLPGTPRIAVTTIRAPSLPGPYTIEAVAVTQDGTVTRATTSLTLWNPPLTLTIVATALVLAAAFAWWRFGRRGHARRVSASAPDE